MKKISLILLIPFGSLIGISILFNVYNDYLKMAASQYNYDYLYICLFRLLEALILFISILVYMKDIQKEDNKLIYLIEGVQIISFIMIIIISSFMVNIYILTFPLLNYLFLWILVIAYRIYKQTLSIPWWRSHPIHENRATESICTEPCNPLLRATKSMKRATSTY